MRPFLFGASLALLVVGMTRNAHADAPPSDELVVTYAPRPTTGCPTPDAFRESVVSRAGDVRVIMGDGSRAGVRARVELDATQGQDARAHVTVTSSDGIVSERNIVGRSCEEVAGASALFVALFAEHEAKAPAAAQPLVTEPSVPRATPAPDTSRPKEMLEERKHVAIGVNPLSFVVKRLSVQLELVPTEHHALTINPFAVWGSRNYSTDGQAYDLGTQHGLGGEIGYRYYTGTRGPNGFFFGPSLIFATYWGSGGEPNAPDGWFTHKPVTYSTVGGAFDAGAQFIVGPGVTLGFGAGAYYFPPTSKTDSVDALIEGRGGLGNSGFFPRLLASVGYAL